MSKKNEKKVNGISMRQMDMAIRVFKLLFDVPAKERMGTMKTWKKACESAGMSPSEVPPIPSGLEKFVDDVMERHQ